MGGLKAVLMAAVSIAVSASAVPGPATAADTGGWGVSSVYTYTDSESTSGPVHGYDLVSRMTFRVPDGLTSVHYDITGATRRWGGATAGNGRVVLVVGQAGDVNGAFEPLTIVFSNDAGDELWRTTVSETEQARSTKLTMATPVARAAAGSKVRVSGTLTAAGKPLAGHWVSLLDSRVKGCEPGQGCSQIQLGVGSAQVGADGRWSTRVPLKWTTNLVATYCQNPQACWDNPNTPAYGSARKITAGWAPKLRVPDRVRARRAATYTVRVSAARVDLPVLLQARLGGTWKTIGRNKVTTSTTVKVRGKLPRVGRVPVRAKVPTFRDWLSPADEGQAWKALTVYEGTSRRVTVPVGR